MKRPSIQIWISGDFYLPLSGNHLGSQKNNHRSRDPELESTIVSSIYQKIFSAVVDIIGIFEIVDTVIIVDMVDIVSVTRRSRSDVCYSLKDDRLERS